MFPTNHENPFPLPYDHPQNPSSTHHDLDHQPPFLLHFPSPFLDDDDSPLSQVFSQPPQHGTHDAAAGDHQAGRGGKTKKGGGGGGRKRNPGKKKDRHSKICTARGVRDRRMRLSLQIARKFFDLQDTLGFDKASKTIEWLFSKSKNAIKDLMRTKNINAAGFSSSDEYEEVGSISTATKESRQEARARARERTIEKKKKKMMMMIRGLENSSPSSFEQLGSSSNSPFLEESCCQEIKSNNPCTDLTQLFSKQYLKEEEIRSNNPCTDSAQWFSKSYLGEEEIRSNNTCTDLTKRFSNRQYLKEEEIRSNNPCTGSAQWFSKSYLGEEEIRSNNTCTNLTQRFSSRQYLGEEESRSNNVPLGFENQFSSSVGIMENYQEHNGESFMGFLGNWDLAGAGSGAGISAYTDGLLAPFPGINPSTTLYFDATSFQFRQPLDQERQISYNPYSLG